MKKYIWIVFITLLWVGCDELDNYDEPNATLTGQIVDVATGKPLKSEQPNGYRIRYREIADKYPNAQYYYFWGKADGTFNNSKMFAAQYEIMPVEGPFVTPEPKIVTIKGKAEVQFEVIPYLVISEDEISLDATSKTLQVTFKVSKPVDSPANPSTAFVALTWNPNVSYNTFGATGSGIRTTRTVSADDLGSTLSFNIDISSLTPNHKWYVVMGCSSSNNTSRFNYSDVHTFEY